MSKNDMAPCACKAAVWRVPVSGEWFYGTKAQCERERADFESTFTLDELNEEGRAVPEPLYANADLCEAERLRGIIRMHEKTVREQADHLAYMRTQLAERDALLREKSGDLIRMAAHLISAPLFALQDLQDEDKKMTRARVDLAVDTADTRLKDAAYELRRIADALSASAEPSAPKCGNCGSSTGQSCNDKGCGHLESGNGEPSAPVEIDERAAFKIVQVLGFPSYSVSSDGLVYRKDSGNAVAQQANAKGYMTVNLSEGGEATRVTVHRVVLESFVGLRPEGMQARHKDGNPANNRLSNLKWGSPSENEADKAIHGTKANGSRNGASRLTEDAVREIIEAKRLGGKKWGAGKLAQKFGVDISTVVRAARGKHWRAALERKPS